MHLKQLRFAKRVGFNQVRYCDCCIDQDIVLSRAILHEHLDWETGRPLQTKLLLLLLGTFHDAFETLKKHVYYDF